MVCFSSKLMKESKLNIYLGRSMRNHLETRAKCAEKIFSDNFTKSMFLIQNFFFHQLLVKFYSISWSRILTFHLSILHNTMDLPHKTKQRANQKKNNTNNMWWHKSKKVNFFWLEKQKPNVLNHSSFLLSI
jgi:hypothetical protein